MNARPVPGVLRRPKRVWLHEAVRTPDRDGIATDGQLLYMLRLDRQQVVAFTAETGREVWATQVSPPPGHSWHSSQLEVTGGVVVVRGSDGRLTGFAASSGNQLWTRQEPCDIERTSGPWAVLRCHGGPKRADGTLRVVDAKSGRENSSIPLSWLGDFGVSDRAIFTWTGDERLLRKTPLVKDESRWEVPMDTMFIEDILADANTVVCAGRDVRAFDAATGKLLWSKQPIGDHRGVAVRPQVQSGSVYLGMADAVIAYEERSGQEQRRYPLPAFLRPQPADHRFNGLLVSGERVLLVNNPIQVSDHYMMASWAAPGEAPQLIARPIALGRKPLLVGDMLIAVDSYDQFAAGYSVADLQSALADLPRADAIRALELEIPSPRLRSLALSQIPGETTAARPPQRPDDSVKLGVCKAARRKIEDLLPGTPAGIFGTAHPIQVEAAAPDGHWVAACQARTDTDGDGGIDVIFGQHGEALGDEMKPYLIIGGGAGHPVDELIGHSPAGRYVATREGSCLNVIDTADATSTTLADADLRDPQPEFGMHRGVSFDAVEGRVLYLRATTRGDVVVVRELKTGREIEIDPGPGLVARAVLDPEGESVLIDVAMGDHLPRLWTTLAPRACRGEAASYSVFGSGEAPPTIVRRIVSAKGGRVREVPGLIRSFGKGLLIRAADRSLVVEDPQGRRKTIVPATCNPTVSHVDSGRRIVVFSCESDADQHGIARVSIYRDGTIAKLSAIDQVERSDSWTQTTGPYVPIYAGVIDLDHPSERPPASAYAGLQPDRFFVRSDGRELRPPQIQKRSRLGRADTGPLQWVFPSNQQN